MPTRRATPATPVFPRNATPPDKHGYPHYQRMAAATVNFKRAYLKEIAARRDVRAKLYRGRANVAKFARRVPVLRAQLAECLGLALAARNPVERPPRFVRGNPLFSKTPEPGTPAWAADLRTIYYDLPNAAWDGGSVELMVLKSVQHRDPKLAPVLLIPDSGAVLFGAQSPETAARAWGLELAAAGFVVGIPKLPGLERFSATQNKRRLLEGACTLGEVVGEAARALDGLLHLSPDKARRAWIAGSGVGATAALLLGATDGRTAGVLCDELLAIGTGSDVDALMVPRFNRTTDLHEIVASLSPRPVVFVKPAPGTNGLAANPDALRTASKSATVFRAGQKSAVIAWMKSRKLDAVKSAPQNVIVRGKIPNRKYAICNVPDAKTWQQWAKKLRATYRVQAGMPAVSKPLDVKLMGRVELPDCTREEYHVRTGEFTWSNLTFLRPHGPKRKRTTILHLPGSGSDVAQVEHPYGHEIVAEGWNACIIDARVALYPWLPNIPEGTAMINQSLHDLCCCLDYVASRDDVDAARIGCMGVSQGGTHTWMLAAMDDRIAAAAPICGACTYRSLWDEWRTEWYDGEFLSFLDSGTIYYTTPGVLHLGDQQDLCGLIAPRPFALIGANHDNCFPLSGMRECDRDLTRLYRLHGKAENFLYYEFDGEHSMPEHSRRAAYAFFKKAGIGGH